MIRFGKEQVNQHGSQYGPLWLHRQKRVMNWLSAAVHRQWVQQPLQMLEVEFVMHQSV